MCIKDFKLYVLGLIESFEDRQELEYRRKMDLQHVIANENGKIWAFIDEAMEYMIVRDE